MAINMVRQLIQATHVEGVFEIACHLAPVDVTKSALYDYLGRSKVRRLGPNPEAEIMELTGEFPYHSAFLAVSELSDLIRDHDTILLGALHSLFDCLPFVDEERRSREDKPIKIPNPQISLLAGTTPAYLSRTFPASAWDEGFMARSILIYSAEPTEPDLFGEGPQDDPLLARELVEDLRQIGRLKGKFVFSADAKTTIVKWQKSGRQPAPDHMRLEHYRTRRMIHALKLSMIASANRSNNMVITSEDFQEALSWMHEAELQMPQIFMNLVGRSEGQIMNELYHYVASIYSHPLSKGQPVRKGLLVNFLRHKVQTYMIDKIIETACEAELLDKVALAAGGIFYKPGKNPSLFRAKKA